MARAWRNWAFESAALDLALRQAGAHAARRRWAGAGGRCVRELARARRPAVGGGRSRERFAHEPDGRLQARRRAGLDDAIVAELAALGCVETVDFKGRYGLEVEDEDALVAMYRVVLAAFPRRAVRGPARARRRGGAARAGARPRSRSTRRSSASATSATRTINVKPSRIGGLRPLLEIYECCAANGVAMYGGGMGELGIGRGQIELLASLFHPDAPNDVAPSAFNAVEPVDGLPSSPLDRQQAAVWFSP